MSVRGLAHILGYAVMVVLAGHTAYYLVLHVREHQFLRQNVLAQIEGESDRDLLLGLLRLAWQLPPHKRSPDYGLKHPLMKILRPSAANVYRNGGHCAKRSRLLTVLLRARDIPARRAYLYNERGLELLNSPPRSWVHVVVEARIDGRWVVADPLFNVAFTHSDGALATAEEIAADPEILRRGRLSADESFDRWEEDLYTYETVARFPWFVVPGKRDWAYNSLRRILSHDSVNRFALPFLFEQPQLAIAVVSALLLVICGLLMRFIRTFGRRAGQSVSTE